MLIDDDTCYRALTARDARFDGLFFVGVTTTRIYCRPICTARTPGRERCRFFADAALAEKAGFRPCLRCRPELAPGHAPVDAMSRTARIAADRIEAGALNDGGSLEKLARDLGLSSRHLRRAVRREFGVSPIELAQTRRLLLAKQLLTESDLPIVRIAFASGFESVRRFNALFHAHYRLTPSRMRRSPSRAEGGDSLRLMLAYRPPLAWEPLVGFLAGRATARVERVEGGTYLRSAAVGAHRGWLKVEPIAGRDALSVELSMGLVPVLPEVLARLKHLFDLGARPDTIAGDLRRDPRLAGAVDRLPGLRVPGAFDGFELATRAILGQRISVRSATTLAGRLADRFGDPIETPFAGLDRLSPSAERIAEADEKELTALGIAAPRAAAIRTIARGVARRELDLQPSPDPAAAIDELRRYPGLGEWTAQYIAMRALRWPDAFPAGDLSLMRAAGVDSPRRLRDAAEAWRPWRSYAAMYLWVTGSEVPQDWRTPMLDRNDLWYCHYSSPVGFLVLTSDGEALTGLHLPCPDGGAAPLPGSGWRRDEAPFRDALDQLTAYFDGQRTSFGLRLRMAGTPFQRLAWDALLTIPYGTTISYAEQARRMGRPGAARAVGAANARNPIAIIVPCHRVIGSSGSLTGYGGGLELKQWLLDHESCLLGRAGLRPGRRRTLQAVP